MQIRSQHFHIALVLYCGAVMIVSVTPNPPVPELGFAHTDKVGHFGMFAIMAGLAWGSLSRSRLNPGAALLFWGPVVFASGYGALCESLQRLAPERTFSWGDMAANVLGAPCQVI